MAGGSVLDLSSVRRLVAAEHGLAVVCATRGDGTVQTSLVNAGITADQRDGREVVGFVARGDAVKLRHFRARPYANIVWRSGLGMGGDRRLRDAHRSG